MNEAKFHIDIIVMAPHKRNETVMALKLGTHCHRIMLHMSACLPGSKLPPSLSSPSPPISLP